MSLENLINKSNDFYAEKEIAIVNKKATPIKVVKVDQESRTITQAFFEHESTVDYCGIYNGKYLEFEAKSTISKTSFSMYNFEPHQIEYFKKVIKQQGVCFVIIQFSSIDRWFLIFIKDIFDMLLTTEKQSLSIEEISTIGHEIKLSFNPPLDYISVLKKLLFK